MEEQKTIYVVLQYSMQVPADMTKDQINGALYDKYGDQGDPKRLNVKDYHDEEEREPWMHLDSVHCGETVELAIG